MLQTSSTKIFKKWFTISHFKNTAAGWEPRLLISKMLKRRFSFDPTLCHRKERKKLCESKSHLTFQILQKRRVIFWLFWSRDFHQWPPPSPPTTSRSLPPATTAAAASRREKICSLLNPLNEPPLILLLLGFFHMMSDHTTTTTTTTTEALQQKAF